MVTITASYTVIPNKPTPECRLWLPNNDHIFLGHHTPSIYVYRTKYIPDAIQRLKNSLSEILVHYYPLAGRLCMGEDGRMELDCNGKGVLLFEAESSKTLDEYGDFAPSKSVRELAPTTDPTLPKDQVPLLLVQLTRFHGDEGLAIGTAISHVVTDGLAFIRFFNSWAKVARGEKLEPHEMPFLDRTVLKLSRAPSTSHFDHAELKPAPLILGKTDSTDEKKKELTTELLKLSSEQVDGLKKKANDPFPKEGSRPYSRFEAIVAHIWRCASKARELDENQPTLVRFQADIRKRLNPPLPQNYFGNALAATVTPTCHVGEIISNSLSYSAQKIREASELLTDEYVRSQIDVMVTQEKLKSIRGYYSGEGELWNAPFLGNPNIHITSWMSMPVYEANFGWGKPMHFGVAREIPHDRALLLFGPNGDGSVILILTFQSAHMQSFKKYFYQDIRDSHL